MPKPSKTRFRFNEAARNEALAKIRSLELMLTPTSALSVLFMKDIKSSAMVAVGSLVLTLFLYILRVLIHCFEDVDSKPQGKKKDEDTS